MKIIKHRKGTAMKKKFRIEEMTPQEFHQAMQARPLIYQPCGLLEWHGAHLPLGLDGLKMEGIVAGCVQRTGGVLLPLNWIGAPGFGSYCGTLTYPPEFVKDLLKRLLAQAAKTGARVIALTTGHYGDVQVNTVKSAAREFMAEHPAVQVLARPEYEGVLVDGKAPADHAGKWETSMALHLFPKLVQLDKHRPGVEPIVQYGEEHVCWPGERHPWMWHEDLRHTASAELGRKAVKAIQDVIVADVEKLCAQVGI
jgi:creatinine amidohydrolase